jgi:hypothetical protein
MTIQKGTEKMQLFCEGVAIGRGGVSGSFLAFFSKSRRLLTKIFKSVATVNWNADVENLGARGNKTGGCYARYQPFSSLNQGHAEQG